MHVLFYVAELVSTEKQYILLYFYIKTHLYISLNQAYLFFKYSYVEIVIQQNCPGQS